MSLLRMILLLILAGAMVVSIMGAALRTVTDPALVSDSRERWEMLGLGSTGLACASLIVALLVTG